MCLCVWLRNFLLSLTRKRYYLYVFACFATILIIVLAVGFYCWSSYETDKEKLENLKSTENHLRLRGTEEKYKAELERIALKIKGQESRANRLFAGWIACVVIFVTIFVLILGILACRGILLNNPELEDYLVMCSVMEYLPSCNLQELCSRSDEDSASQMARDVSASFGRAAPESVVFRGTLNTGGGAEQEAEDLPGVPSTSNN